LSDEILLQFYKQFEGHTLDRPRNDYAVNDSIKADVWLEPTSVWEILGADLSISPKYTAAAGHVSKGKGISLRFPRFIRLREDKKPSQATTAAQVLKKITFYKVTQYVFYFNLILFMMQIADLYRAQGLNTTNDNDEEDDELL